MSVDLHRAIKAHDLDTVARLLATGDDPNELDDAEAWIYFDGPEPEHIRPLLDALRDLPPATPEDKERALRRFLARLDATLSRREEPAGAEEGRASDAPGAPLAPRSTGRSGLRGMWGSGRRLRGRWGSTRRGCGVGRARWA